MKLLRVVTASVSLSVQRLCDSCSHPLRRRLPTAQYHLDGDDAKITAAHVLLDALENSMPASKLEYQRPALGLIERLQRRKRKLRLVAHTADYLGKRRSCLAKQQGMNTG